MDAAEYARRYAAAQVTMVDPQRLLALVLEGGERFLRLAHEALAAGDLRRFAGHLARAQAVITALGATLDPGAGRLARDLARLYDFLLVHLGEGNARRSERHVAEVRALFATIADAFRAILPLAGA